MRVTQGGRNERIRLSSGPHAMISPLRTRSGRPSRELGRDLGERRRQVNDFRAAAHGPHADCPRPSLPPPSLSPEIISYAAWLYLRFPLSLRTVEEMLAVCGICVTYETLRQWGKKFGKAFADQIRRRTPARGDKWPKDEVVISIAGEPHWLWRAVDQNGFVLDVLVQR
jgi:hypothetical protein